jgi:hypothetical protein
VRRLLEVGVESYFCDLVKRQETFYARDGKTHVGKMAPSLSAVAGEFCSSDLIAVIRAAQTDINLQRPDGSEVRHVGCTMPPA